MSSSEETSHTSLPQSTDPVNSTTNDLSKVRNPQTQAQECVNSPTDSHTVYPTVSSTLSDANIDCETYENNESPESSNNETEQHPSNNETEHHSSQVDQIEEEPVRYELPPRTNRCIPPKRYTPEKEARRSRYPIANIAKGNLSPEAQIFTTSLYFEEILTSVEQALKSKVWREAMKTELDALSKNDTMERSANKRWPLHQFDVTNAFLHGELKKEVYMDPPPEFVESSNPREVCRLKKSLYGLKQSPRAWFGRFTLAMRKYGFKQSNSDHTLFLKWKGKLVTCLIIYVDDMIITGNDEEEMTRLRTNLFKEFEMNDLGRLKYFLGIEVLRMTDCKPVDNPMMVNQKLYMEEKTKLADKGMYQRIVGKLIYLSHTRPDIAYAVGVVSQFMHQPQISHMKAVLRIIRYLKGTPGHGVLFKANRHLETQVYTDRRSADDDVIPDDKRWSADDDVIPDDKRWSADDDVIPDDKRWSADIGNLILEDESFFKQKIWSADDNYDNPLILASQEGEGESPGDYNCQNVLTIWPKLRKSPELRETYPHIQKPRDIGEAIKKNLPAYASDMLDEDTSIEDVGFVAFALSRKWMAESIHKMLNYGIDTWAPKLPVERVLIAFLSLDEEIHARYFQNLPNWGEGILRRLFSIKNIEGDVVIDGKGIFPFILAARDLHNSSKDLAALRVEIEVLKADWIVYVTPVRQQEYIEMCFTAAKLEKWITTDWKGKWSPSLKKEYPVASYVGYRTCSAKLAELANLLGQVRDRCHLVAQGKDARLLGYIANAVFACVLMYTLLKNDKLAYCTFTFDEMVNEEGNTFVYLLHRRAEIHRITSGSRKDIDELKK
nr:putative reverse transcriptase, RNA-dependent DNA polymerase [Tanacetum cinerariifolium]